MDETKLPGGPKLNLGCGPVQPVGWINIDGSNRCYLASRWNGLDGLLVKLGAIPPTAFSPATMHHDLSRGLPFADDSVSCIYSGELWEHFELADAAKLTRECRRVLKRGGVLRLCVPDGPTFWGKYLRLYEEQMAKPRAERRAKALAEHTQVFFDDICTRRKYLGSMGHTHKWNFDEVQLVEMLEASGFSRVERMEFHKSRIPDVGSVERSDFLIVEGVK